MSGLRQIVEQAYTNGKNIVSYYRKVPSNAAVAARYVDLSMAPGTPTANYYIGGELEATVPTNWYRKGIWHGGDVAPDKKFLHKAMLLGTTAAVAPVPFMLCDYLMYYPIIDMDSTDEQFLINTTASLPRYTDGLGVQAFLVATNPYVGGASFQIKYTNSDGVTDRISQIAFTNIGTNIGTILNSNISGTTLNIYKAFIGLQQSDRGIRSIESITFTSPNGGLASLVLVKPLATIATREPGAWAEFDFIKEKPSLPQIMDGAHLDLLVFPSATIAAIPVIGEFSFIWTS